MLAENCLISSEGRIIPQRRCAAKLSIIDQEFTRAERAEARRVRSDELKMQKAQARRAELDRVTQKFAAAQQQRENEQRRTQQYRRTTTQYSFAKNLANLTDVRKSLCELRKSNAGSGTRFPQVPQTARM